MNIDTTSIAVYTKGTKLYDFGYFSDKRPDLRKRSTRFIIDSLQNLTVTYTYDGKQAVRRIYSNFKVLNSRILKDIVVVSSVSGG